MGCVDGNGTDQFNFPQTVWLYPRVPMRATPRFTRAAEVLAVNILSLVLAERDHQAFQGRTSARAIRLARDFYLDCLSELPAAGWCIPLDTIREWASTALRAQIIHAPRRRIRKTSRVVADDVR